MAVRGCRRTRQSVQGGDRSIKERTLRRLDRPWHHVKVDLIENLAVTGLQSRITTMLALTPARTLTSADLKDNLHDIQDNVVAPILMRYGRHLFVKFNDGTKARAWLRSMFKHVNTRSKEHGTCFTVNIGFTYEGLKALGLSQRSLDSFPEAFQGRHARPCEGRGRSRTARAGALGSRARRSRHSCHGFDPHRFRGGPRAGDSDHSR